MTHLQKFFLVIISLTVVIFPASARAAVNIPSSADPSRVQEQIAPPTVQEVLPQAKGAAPVITPEEAPPGADKIRFVLKAVQIEDMTVYKEVDVAPLYRKLLGTKISLVQVYGLANELTAKYRNDGYILTQAIVPPQTIKGGRIKLRVIEGFIDQVHIQSKKTGDEKLYAPYGDLIKESQPLNEKVLEKYMLLINDLPGVTAKSVLSPSPKTQGASDLIIEIEHKLYDASVETDNRGTLYIGPQQFNASTRLNNALGQNEGITLQGASAPGDMNSGTVSISHPIGYQGTTLNLSGAVTSTNPGYTLAQFDIKGVTHEYIAGVTRPFIRSRNENFSGTFKFDFFDTTRSDNLGGPMIEDRMRILRMSLLYQNADRFEGVNTLTTEISKGIDIFNTKPEGSPNMTRDGGNPLFFKQTFEATRVQRLTDIFDLYTAATGQKSPDNLLTSEAFGVGGASYGSAYDSSEITGNNGIAGRVELRANNPVHLPFQKFQPYGFYDIGKVWDPENTDPKSRIVSIASAGMGLRATLNDTISGSLEFAAPLTKDIEAGHSMQPRLFSSLTAKF